MLCNKIHKVAMATALWTMALLGASLANARINLDATGVGTDQLGTVTYSAEGLASNAAGMLSGKRGFYAVSATGTMLLAVKKFEPLALFRLSRDADNTVFVRVQGSGGLWLARNPELRVTGGDAVGNTNCVFMVAADGSLSGSGFSIYEIDPADVNADGNCSAFPDTTPGTNGIVSEIHVTMGGGGGAGDPATANTAVSAGTGMLTIAAYETGNGAYRETAGELLFSKTVAATRTASSIAVAIQKGTTATADVETGFMRFVNNSGSATLGSVSVTASPSATNATSPHLMPDGDLAASNLASLIGRNSTVKIDSADGFTYGTFKLGTATLRPVDPNPTANNGNGTLGTGATCTDSKAEGVTVTSCSTALTTGSKDFTVTLMTGDKAKAIPPTMFQATVMFSDTANTGLNAVLPANVGPRPIGQIVRNGSTFQIPMLTTSDNYNHRIIFVNRSDRPASYTMSFTTEEGTTAQPNPVNSAGTLAAGKTTVLRVSDVVGLTGNSRRTAATVNVAGAAASIDLITQLVSLADQSTDSVRYEADQVRIQN